MFYLLVIGVLAYAFGTSDGTKIKYGEYIDTDEHRWRFLLRAFTIVCLSLTNGYESIYEYALFVVFLGTFFWMVFDITVGLTMNKHWLYLGDTAKIDKFANKHIGEYYYFFIKFAIFIGTGIGYLMI